MTSFLKQTALAAGLLAIGFGVHAQTITLKVHHFMPNDSVTQREFLQPWADRISRESMASGGSSREA